jgi:uncharacterized membrane protein
MVAEQCHFCAAQYQGMTEKSFRGGKTTARMAIHAWSELLRRWRESLLSISHVILMKFEKHGDATSYGVLRLFIFLMHTVHRFFHHRPRLTVSAFIGAGVAAILPGSLSWVTRALVAWNFSVWSYLILMGWLMTRATHARVSKIAQQEDRSAVAVLSIMSVASVVSIAAIILELAAVKSSSASMKPMHYVLTGATVFGSWLLVATLYTFHYARLFYTAPAERRPLRFPDDEANPDYWDFLYFSFTIAVAAQTSDISVLSRSMRKTVLAQSILSFLFNVAIVGLSINIAASVVSS